MPNSENGMQTQHNRAMLDFTSFSHASLSDPLVYPPLLGTWSLSYNPFRQLCLLAGDPCSNFTGRYWHILLYNTIDIYVYIYISSISSLIQMSLNIIDIFCLHIFLVDPFILPFWFYCIRRELIDESSIIVYFPSTFYPTLVKTL